MNWRLQWSRSLKLNFERVTQNEKETIEMGKVLGERLRGGEVIALSGPLGAGKTSFAKGVGEGLDIAPEALTSPTFILRAEHRGKLPLAHIDLYRLDSVEEIQNLGLFDQEDPRTILLIEWPEKADRLLPFERVEIKIVPEGESRRRLTITLKGTGFSYLFNGMK